MAIDDDEAAGEPPRDPEEWSDEQWITWLKRTDELNDPEATSGPTAMPLTHMGRVVRSSGGQVIGSAMLGMAQAIFGVKEDEVVHVIESGSEPGPDEPFSVHLDPEHPERSTVVFRNPTPG